MRKIFYISILVVSLFLFGCSNSSDIENLENKITELENQIDEYENTIRNNEKIITEKESIIVEYEDKFSVPIIYQEDLLKHFYLRIELLEQESDNFVINYQSDDSRLWKLLYADLGEVYTKNWYDISDEQSFIESSIQPFISEEFMDINNLIIKVYDRLGYYYNCLANVEMDNGEISQSDVKKAYQDYLDLYKELTNRIISLDN